ncbi:MAG TPA: response regulator [Acidiferrobacterales bacterium]
MPKRALVVDDSQLARVTLRRLLEQRQLDVDTAESAEDALDHLRRNAPPSVIFLDHMMPGMDGFQTMSELKRNPITAAIPVVMYTSREGQAYMGQARALGAADVLAKPVNQAELDRILQRLELGADVAAAPRAMTGRGDAAAVSAPGPAPESSESLDAIARRAAAFHAEGLDIGVKALLEEQRAALRHELLAQHDAVAERVIERLRDELGGIGAATAAPPAAALRRPALVLATVGVAIAASLMIYNAWVTRESPPAAEPASPPAAAPAPVADDGLAAENARLREQLARNRGERLSDRAQLVRTLEWAANLNGQVEYDRPLLGDEQVVLLSEVLTRLSAVEFRGTVRVTTHVGEFCMVRSPLGLTRLPGDDQPFDSCQVMGMSVEQASAWGARQSLGFARFLATSPLANSPSVRIELQSLGKDAPLLRYPLPGTAQTAGDWNRVARHNNRVEIAIVPAAP